MSQCVPNWDLDDVPTSGRLTLHPNSTAPDETTLDYEVAELTWQNGHLVMHGLGPPRVVGSKALSNTASKYTWEKPRASGTLESIVNQATRIPLAPTPPPPPPPPPPLKAPLCTDELVPWLDHQHVLAHPNLTMDALVPCSKPTTTTNDYKSPHVPQQNPSINKCSIECSTRVGSCSGTVGRKHMMDAHVPVVTQEGCSRNQSASTSATYGRDSRYVTTVDTCEKGLYMGFTSTSLGSLENTSSGKQTHTSYTTTPTTGDDHDSVCHSTPQEEVGIKEDKKKNQTRKSSVSTKRSRAAAIHNQSERKRRDRINQKMKTLQKLVPNSSKTDKASMLDEVIEYLKQLQAHVQMMNRMSMSQMMLPITMQQQLQMSLMSQMGMGVGMGMGMGMGVGMDMNSIPRPTIPGIPPLMHPAAFMHLPSWDNSSDHRLSSSGTVVMPDPLSSLLACQTQPMSMDAYSRMAALYQQLASNPKT